MTATISVSSAYADDYADVNRLIRAGQYGEALTKADQYLSTKPRDPQMRFLKGVLQTETNKTSDAIGTFTKITEDYPELPEPYNNLAVLYAGQSQFDKARAALEMAIRTNPSYATAHENLGDVYARLASQAYSKALQLDGTNTAVQPKLALIRTLFSAQGAQKQPAGSPSAANSVPTGSTAVKAATTLVAIAPPVKVASVPVLAVTPAKPAVTTVATAPTATVVVEAGAEKSVEAAVNAWAEAWSGKNMDAYLGSYGKTFDPPGKQSRTAWEQERRNRIVSKSRIAVNLSNISVSVQGTKATAKFKQDYAADSLTVSSRKTLEFVKFGDRWMIVKEFTGN